MRNSVLRFRPTPEEALVFWLNAAGMTIEQINKATNSASDTTRSRLKSARQLAKRHRIWYISTETKEEVPEKSGSGMAYLKQLAEEAGLK
jgi:hypothetical protein